MIIAVKHRLARIACLLFASGTLALAEAPAAASDGLPQPLAAGVFCASQAGPKAAGTGALLVFAGWKVEPAWAWAWLQALLGTVQARHATPLHCAVQGPSDSAFQRKDIDTLALARQLAAELGAPGSGPITLVAHSSGSYVAHQVLQQLRAQGGLGVIGRIRYFNLDGDIGTEERALDAKMMAQLAEVHAVYAIDGEGGESANAATMRALHAQAPGKVQLRALRAEREACAPASRWCLHQVLVTRRPHLPGGLDVARDYGDLLTGRPVQDDYLSPR